MAVSLSRTLIFAEDEQAHELVRVLTTLTGGAEPSWTNHRRRDGSISAGTSVSVGGTVIAVRVGWAASPALIELATDQPLDEVRSLLADVHGCARSWPADGPLEWVEALVGEAITVRVVAAEGPQEMQELYSTISSTGVITLQWLGETGGVAVRRSAVITPGTRVAELLHDQPPALVRWAVDEVGRLRGEEKEQSL